MTDIVISIHVEVNKEKMKIETLKGEQTNFDKINNILRYYILTMMAV